MELLKELVLMLLVSIGVVGITQILRIPSVIGFILTGILIGPGALGLVHSAHNIEVMSEVGVMLLMFTIGLEFSLRKIIMLKKEVLGLGGIQVLATILAVFGFYMLKGCPSISSAIVVSFVVSMSSTALVLKWLKEKGKLQTPHGRVMTGILLFQDICVVPFLIITPLLGKQGIVGIHLAKNLLISFAGIGIIFILAKYVMPKFFNLIYKIKLQELFFILVLSSCFGLSLATASLGFSLSLGSFIAGMILAESDFIYQIESEIHSLKNLFLSLFFISIGLLLDLRHLTQHFADVGLTLSGILGIKILVIAFILFAFRYPADFSLLIGLGLSQIGEFSFILLNQALGLNIIESELYQNILSATIISMMATPGFLFIGNKIIQRDELKKKIAPSSELQGHVIIGGFGVSGQNIARILKNLQIPYVIIEFNPATVKKFRNEGEPIIFGDITNRNNLRQLGSDRASMLLLALSDWDASIRAVKTARLTNPNMKIIVRTEYVNQIEPLYQAGADIVISQEFESSLEMAYHVMKYVKIPEFVARFNTRQLRKKHYSFFNQEIGKGNPIKLSEIVKYKTALDVYLLPRDNSDSAIEIKKIFEQFPEVSVLAILRAEQIIKNPPRDMEFYPCDILVFTGPSNDVDNLVENLNRLF
ncbi:MAG: cation:proton antiporter [Bacteroidia bacterium]|nr:cation:proton antiporter [Bacteroidia bacterium]